MTGGEIEWKVLTTFEKGKWVRELHANGKSGWYIAEEIAKTYGVPERKVTEKIKELEEKLNIRVTLPMSCESKRELRKCIRKFEQFIKEIEEWAEKESLIDWIYERMVYDREKGKFVKA